jgi:hypothetical protein
MLRERSHSLLKDQRGATAATFGLALFALVAVGGMGFDYARLAGMDSELQNAATRPRWPAPRSSTERMAHACAPRRRRPRWSPTFPCWRTTAAAPR